MTANTSSEQTLDARISAFLDTLADEGEALTAFGALKRRFNFSGTVFTSDDIATAVWNNLDGYGISGDSPLADVLTDAIAADQAVNKVITETLAERGNEIVDEEVSAYLHTFTTADQDLVLEMSNGTKIAVQGFETPEDAMDWAENALTATPQQVADMVRFHEGEELDADTSTVSETATVTAGFLRLDLGGPNGERLLKVA